MWTVASQHFLYVSYGMIFWAVSNFLSLLCITAPYGKYLRKGWGFYVNARLAWFVQELPSLLIPIYLVSSHVIRSEREIPGVIMAVLFIIHYIHRAVIYPYRIKHSKPIPAIPVVIAFLYCTLNGYLQVGYLLRHAAIETDIFFVAGIALFLFGMCTNIHSDNILRSLRQEGQNGYKIPRGGMFEYVSGANFLGEILEWAGFAIACRTVPSLAFALFTFCNLGPRAFHHHRFYLEKFEDYPKDRKALIPYCL